MLISSVLQIIIVVVVKGLIYIGEGSLSYCTLVANPNSGRVRAERVDDVRGFQSFVSGTLRTSGFIYNFFFLNDML